MLYGFVHDTDHRPLYNVTIAYSDRPYVPLAVTNYNGTFEIPGVCASPTSILATKTKYGDVMDVKTSVIDKTTSRVDITMNRLGKHVWSKSNFAVSIRLISTLSTAIPSTTINLGRGFAGYLLIRA